MGDERGILEFKNVSGNAKNNFGLYDISFCLPAGYIAGIAGENGAGKTTLFDYIMNPKKQYKGEILIEGKEVHEDYAAMRQQIGFVSDKNVFFMCKSAKQNAQIAECFFETWDMDLFEKTMKEMKVSLTRPLSKLSRGEYLKYQTAYAMAHHPKVYLLDEVTAGMDPVYRVDYFRLLQKLIESEDVSVLMISHIQEEMERKMDYIGIMQDGCLASWEEAI